MERLAAGDKFLTLEWEWGWTLQWFGWRRCLWLAVCIDFQSMHVGVILFGLLIGWGRKVKPVIWNTTRTG